MSAASGELGVAEDDISTEPSATLTAFLFASCSHNRFKRLGGVESYSLARSGLGIGSKKGLFGWRKSGRAGVHLPKRPPCQRSE